MQSLRLAIAVSIVTVGVLALGLLQVTLVFSADAMAVDFPEAAHLTTPILALALAFCGCGQAALLLAGVLLATRATDARLPRGVVGTAAALIVVLVVMAGLVVAIVLITAAEQVTPPALALVGWGGSAVLTAAAATTAGVLVAGLRGQRGGPLQPATTPADRAGSA